MKTKVKWFRHPNGPGAWWYWLLGSGMTRHNMVRRNLGIFDPKHKGRLECQTDGWGPVKKKARLWCKSAGQPKLPPLKLRKKLELEITTPRPIKKEAG